MASKARIKDSREDRVFYLIVNVLMALVLIIVLYPLIYVVSSSFSDGHAVRNGNPLRVRNFDAPLGAPVRAYLEGKFCGIVERDETGLFRFKAMLYKDE